MTAATFIGRSLRYFKGSYLALLAVSAVGAMIWLGALLAASSVNHSLRNQATLRLGGVASVWRGDGRWFRSALADNLTSWRAAPICLLRAVASNPANGRSIGAVQVVGVDERFWRLRPATRGATPLLDQLAGRACYVNDRLARDLASAAGDAVILRFEQTSAIAAEVPLAGKVPAEHVLRADVQGVVGEADFGSFDLGVRQSPRATVFVPLARLQSILKLPGMANILLLGERVGSNESELCAAIRRHCQLIDYGIELKPIPAAAAIEIRSKRIFIDAPMASAIRQRFPEAQPVLTYLANSLKVGGRDVPYSMVCATTPAAAPFLSDITDGIVINDWLAKDLGAKQGDQLSLDYYAMDGRRRLVERQISLPVAAVLPMQGLAADHNWMPDFPGVADAESTSDWDPGIPIDFKRIRDKDEVYWNQHRGTPKAFLPWEIVRKLFGNPWGESTGLRLPVSGPTGISTLENGLLDCLSPGIAGFRLQQVRQQAIQAADSPVDFAGLLVGMSLFLISAALGLTAMLFRFHIEQRNRESGLLAVLGVSPRRIARWHLGEGMILAVAGGALGGLLAFGYARVLLHWIETIWRGPLDPPLFEFHADWGLLGGGLLGWLGAMLGTILWACRRQAAMAPGLRLAAGSEEITRPAARRLPRAALGFGALGILASVSDTMLGMQGAFFAAGVACLLAGISAYGWLLRRATPTAAGNLSARQLAVWNGRRRPQRSMAAVGSMAAGVFLVIAVSAFRQQGGGNWRDRESGAGGFALWVESTRPIQADALTRIAQSVGEIVPLRAGMGDDASCLNLNQITQPRLLALDSARMHQLNAFIPATTHAERAWKSLAHGDVMRGWLDRSTLQWVLKKKIGDQLIYQDEWGRDFPIEIAGTLDDSVFQGALVVDENRYLAHYPSAPGPTLVLVGDKGDMEQARAALDRELADSGPQITSTRERIRTFHEVENTYITVFQMLGGLGVVLGSTGLGVVVARNLLERRAEFLLLHALGIPTRIQQRVIIFEVAQIISWGMGIGMLAAAVAIAPNFRAGDISSTLVAAAALLATILTAAAIGIAAGMRGLDRRII